MNVQNYFTRRGLEINYTGPPLSNGPLPSVFYFALSSQDSLLLEPFNHPVQQLFSDNLRIFSVSIPGHGGDLPKEKALEFWATKIKSNICPLSHFFEETIAAIEELKPYFLQEKIAVCGLSRGGFVALHIASRLSYIKKILAFAPLIQPEHIKEFQDLKNHPLVKNLSLDPIMNDLLDKNIRFYIGNRDLRVGTLHSFRFITHLANLAYEKRIKYGSFEMNIKTSIGYLGHGTAFETFKDGTTWLKNTLLYDE